MTRFPNVFGRPGTSFLLVAALASLLLLGGTSSEAVNRCAGLTQVPGTGGARAIDDGSLSRSQLEEVAAGCRRAFDTTSNPATGLAAAKADYFLGRDEQALAWLHRLRGTSVEPGAWSVAAGVYERRRDLKRARAAREQILTLRLAANDHREAARAYYMLHRIAFSEGNLRDQIEFLRLTYEEAAKAQSRDYQTLAIQSIISPLLEIGDLNSARRALKVATEVTQASQKPDARLSNAEGIIHLREGQSALAIASFSRALQIAGGNADAAILRPLYLNLLEASLRAGNLDAAERYLKSALRYADNGRGSRSSLPYFQALVARTRGRYEVAKDAALAGLAGKPLPDWAWQLEYELGRALQGLGDIVAAAAAFTRSVGHVETVRESVNVDDFKVWLLERRRDPYEALFLVHARAGESRKALEVFERAKARTFLDAFIRAASTTRANADDITLLRESTHRVDGLQALMPAMSKSPAVQVHPIDLVLSGLGNRDVLMYFEAGDELWLISHIGSRIRLHLLSRSTASVHRLVERVLMSPDEPAAAIALSDVLLPHGALPPRGSTLHVVSDGLLGRVPFALLRPGGRELVRDYAISYVPSLNALYAASLHAPATYDSAVVLGDPRGDLPAAALESREVAARLGVSPLLGAAATRDQLQKARYARVLHLSTHTGLDPRGAWAAMADGDVGAAALIAQRLQPRLTVLATCASAAKEGGDMWGSLASAFLAAGSHAVVASLWSIDDEDARMFITRFYDEGGAEDSVVALARAQRAFLDAGRPPSFWAPYVHFGTSRVTGQK
jgi:tetratricopeptide (TPR) repeat protein